MAELVIMVLSEDTRFPFHMSGTLQNDSPAASVKTAQSILRHSWYLDPTVVVFALIDGECSFREEIARKLYSIP